MKHIENAYSDLWDCSTILEVIPRNCL